MNSLAAGDLRARSFRRGPLKVSHRPVLGSSRMMFAVPKSLGNAVTRNRARRRVRAVLQELQRDNSVMFEQGEYRISILAPLTNVSPKELRAMMLELLTDLRR